MESNCKCNRVLPVLRDKWGRCFKEKTPITYHKSQILEEEGNHVHKNQILL